MNANISVEIWLKPQNTAQKQNPKCNFFRPYYVLQKYVYSMKKIMHNILGSCSAKYLTEETQDKISLLSNLWINLLN